MKIKRIALSGVTLALVFLLVISGVLLAVQKANANIDTAYAQTPQTQSAASTAALVHGTVAPLIVPLTSEPGETQTGKLYADNGHEIMFIRETGQLITANGELLHTVSDNAMARYDEVTQELLDSANRAMKIWFDSVSQKHKLQSGSGQTLKHIKASDMIYISTILDRHDGFTKTIYVTREKIATNWWDRLLGWQNAYYYKYYDMNGRHIPDDWFVEHSRAPWWKSALRVLSSIPVVPGVWIPNPAWLYGLFVGYEPLQSVAVTEVGTFGEITDLLEFATFHPWDKLDGVLTVNNDGEYNSGVYINPANKQLCDRLGAPIYHIETGFPFILHDSKIITIPDKAEQTVTDGILQNGATRQYLRNLGFEEYIHYIDSYEFGVIGVLVLAVKDKDGKLDKWVLPNGEDADGIVRDGIDIDTDGEPFSLASLWEKLTGLFQGIDIGGIVWAVIGILLLIFCFPLVITLVKALLTLLIFPFKWLAKKLGSKKQ
ncbi:MAG: hypothetical protein WDA65_08920 [Christensenellales bacterium]